MTESHIMVVLASIWVPLWQTLTAMAPFLLFGFGVAGLLSVFVPPESVERHLGGKGAGPIVKAALFGIPLPLCSCGVIPVAASLRRHGASRGATASFLISTPQTGVDSIMVTYSLLGPLFAIFRPLAAFVSGVLGGWLTDLLGVRGENGPAAAVPACTDACCSVDKSGNRFFDAMRYGFVTLPRDIGRSMLVGLFLAGLIAALVPDDFFAGALGHGPLAMLAMVALGIPLYVCATASVPIAAALIAKGVSPGAALVFLMTGPATNAAAIVTIWKILGGRATVGYLAAVAFTAIGSGVLLDAAFTFQATTVSHAGHWMAPPWVGTVSAVVLLAVIGLALLRHEPALSSSHAHDEPDAADLAHDVLLVEGMTCTHCAESVRRAVSESAGVRDVAVDLRGGTVEVSGHGYDPDALARTIESLGYRVRQKAPPPAP